MALDSCTFNDLCDDAIKRSEAENSEKQTYELRLRIEQLRLAFGSRPADSIRKNEVVEWLRQSRQRSANGQLRAGIVGKLPSP